MCAGDWRSSNVRFRSSADDATEASKTLKKTVGRQHGMNLLRSQYWKQFREICSDGQGPRDFVDALKHWIGIIARVIVIVWSC